MDCNFMMLPVVTVFVVDFRQQEWELCCIRRKASKVERCRSAILERCRSVIMGACSSSMTMFEPMTISLMNEMTVIVTEGIGKVIRIKGSRSKRTLERR
jgi:hypothetical protein